MQAHFSLKHFSRLMGPHGLYQHADTNNPLLSEGYCTDDNARAVQLLVHLVPLLTGAQRTEAEKFLVKCWEFVREAQIEPGSFINFRAADGQWLPRRPESEDMYARVVRCLTAVMIHDKNVLRREEAERMLDGLAPRVESFTAPRAWAETLIALSEQAEAGVTFSYAKGLQEKGYRILTDLWQKNASEAWPWFEPEMTYANALFLHGLLGLARQTKENRQDKILEDGARFLMASTIRDNIFIPIGSDGWYAKGGQPSSNNQQPIEAGLMFDWLLDYQKFYPERVANEQAAAPYLWFWGRNTGRVVLADSREGASYDGLYDDGINKHRGAESMLAYLGSEILLVKAPAGVRNYIQEEKKRMESGI